MNTNTITNTGTDINTSDIKVNTDILVNAVKELSTIVSFLETRLPDIERAVLFGTKDTATEEPIDGVVFGMMSEETQGLYDELYARREEALADAGY